MSDKQQEVKPFCLVAFLGSWAMSGSRPATQMIQTALAHDAFRQMPCQCGGCTELLEDVARRGQAIS